MPMHMTPDEYAEAIRALGLAAPTVADDDTKPSTPQVPARVNEPQSVTRAYQIVKSAIQLSAAMFGAPRIDLDTRAAAYVIATAPSTRLRFTIAERAATIITTQTRMSRVWVDLDRKRFQKITPSELSTLLVLFHQGEAPCL